MKQIHWQTYAVHNDNEISGFFGPYRFLSNFELCEVYYEGLHFTSSEAAYQAAKTSRFSDRKKISLLGPYKAKQAGRLIGLRTDWEKVKELIMREILVIKFRDNPELGVKLLSTYPKKLVEMNHWNDREWGVDLAGVGKNKLGNLLESVRLEMSR